MEFLKKTSWTEKVIFSGALAVFVASVTGVLLFNRIFAQPVIDPADVIAKMVYVNNSVKRHTPFQFEFVEIARLDPVGNGDTVFSGHRSSARLEFKEGSTLDIAADSLVVVRMRDGKIEVKIDRGEISGNLKDKTQIEVQSEEESVTMVGDKSTEFQLSYMPKVGLEMKKYVKLQTGSKDSEVGEAAPRAHKGDSGAVAPPDTSADAPPASSKESIRPFQVKPFQIDESIKMMPKKYSLKTPSPADNALVLHKGEFQLAVFPKPSCEQTCQLDIYLDGQKYYSREFATHNVPIVYIKIAKDAAGKLRWILRDNGTETKGQFELMRYTEEDFAQAMKDKRSIEIAD